MEYFSRFAYFYGPLIIICYLVITIIVPPLNFPKNIPTIPIYISFFGLFTSLDQQQIYEIYLREKLEKYGAVKIYFASRWNILVTKPELLTQIFKDEETFAKSGNQVKIPYSVLSEYTGDNIISAHGTNWRLYRNVLTHVIQFPDLIPVMENSKKFVDLISSQIEVLGPNLSISDAIQRFSLANIADCMLGIDLKLFTSEPSILNEKLKFVKSQIFKPIYLNFPYLDKFPIPSRTKARNEIKNFRDYYCGLIQKQEKCNDNVAGRLLEALNNDTLTKQQFSDNAMIIMIAGHENPQLLLSSLLYVLSQYPTVQEKLRLELENHFFNEQILDELPFLNSIIYETLRMYPPLGQIINRLTTVSVLLGDIKLPKGVYVGYNNFATGRDRTVWPDADVFNPERWGVTLEEINRNFTRAKSSARLPAFHGRKRACLGEKFALFEMRQVLNQLLKSYTIKPDPNWENKLSPGGPVSPFKLKLIFENN